MAANNNAKASVLLVGCGCPGKSMGWYHAEQLLADRCPSALLRYIVEPFFMNEQLGVDAAGFHEFHSWRKEQEKKGVAFFESVEEVPDCSKESSEKRLGIISSRTADNPKLLSACVKAGCCTIYLEKPGAPTVKELETMKDEADAAGCNVFMGFNKNVSAFLSRARDFAETSPTKCDITFLHNNAYKSEELPECFERNAEGMLKNMAIHELAILATYYDVTIENIAAVTADKEFSSFKSLIGPASGKSFSDFDKLKFKITTKSGKEASVAADRCGGDDSVGIVTDSATGKELARFTMPDEDAVTNIPVLERQYPGAMPYFYTQDPDYCKLKECIAAACVSNNASPDGVATINTAIASLKLAEFLTPLLQEQLK